MPHLEMRRLCPVPKQLSEFDGSNDLRHSRAEYWAREGWAGKPVVRGDLGSRLRGNDVAKDWKVKPGLIFSFGCDHR